MNITEENGQLKIYNGDDYTFISFKEWEYLNHIKNKYQEIVFRDNKATIVYKNSIMLEDLKPLLVDLLKQNLRNYIYSIYSQEKQTDIIARLFGYTDEDFQEMKDFFDKTEEEYKNKKNQIMSCKDHNELLNIELDFNGK